MRAPVRLRSEAKTMASNIRKRLSSPTLISARKSVRTKPRKATDRSMLTVDPAAAGFDARRLEHITAHLNKHYIDSEKIAGCQTLVARRGHVAYYEALGLMDRERNKPTRADTIFRLYSMTKPITAVALMQLYEQGMLQLNDPVHRVIPEWRNLKEYVSGEGAAMQTRPAPQPITFRHLLTHTAGLTSAGGPMPAANLHPVDQVYRELDINTRAGQSLQEFVQKLARAPLRYTPGERWMYSLASDVCAYLVEALSGKPFERYLREHIFDPLGMKDTSFVIAPDKLERFAACYLRGADKSLKLQDDPLNTTY